MTLHASRERGFTLVELLIVVAIIAIITAVAYPSYQDHLVKARRAEGKSALLRALQLEERAYTASSDGRYVTDLAPLFGLTAGSTVRSGEDPNKGNYVITAEVDPAAGSNLQQGVLITATPTGSFVGKDPDCNVLTVTTMGVKNATGSKGAAFCWKEQ